MSQARILKIAVPCPLYGVFDYSLPASMHQRDIQAGMRVLVPFGRQKLTGIIIEQTDTSDCPAAKLKAIIELPDDKPVLSEPVLALLKWAANYYLHPLGDVLQTALPVYLRQTANAYCEKAGDEIWCLPEANIPDSPDTINKTILKRAPKQQQIYGLIAASKHGLNREQLDQQNSNWQSAVKALIEKSLVKKAYQPFSWQVKASKQASRESHDLNSEQLEAVDSIIQTFPDNEAATDKHAAAIHCLFGVTGSGKTEVYLELSEHALKQGKQVLVLVPEISLTPQLTQRFSERLNSILDGNIAVLHSGLNESQRYAAWYAASHGEARLVIGTRSSIFAPLPDLGLIIVDEEHDGSYKQQDGFRYNARDLAVIRAHQARCPAVLGSATPSLETLNNINEQRYQVHYLHKRANTRALPAVQLLNLCNQKLHEGLSEPLLTKIKQHLQNKGQALLFINRRGFAPLLMCHDCGWTTKCHRCDANMTYHKKRHQLHCHHCDSQRPAPEQCGECGSSEVIAIGSGTERIENYLQEIFSDTQVSRIDRDTTRNKGALQEKLAQAHSGESGILVGTQMLAKGHDFPNMTLVVVLDTDQALYSSDFRASEHLAQLITQVSGRAGRAEKTGEVLIQTHHPDHPLLQTLLHQGYEHFAKDALAERKAVGLPPTQHLILLRGESVGFDDAKNFLSDVADLLKTQNTEVDIFGPIPAPMERRAGRFRYQLMLQATQRKPLHVLLQHYLPQITKLKSVRKVRWSIDVDPYDTF